MPKFLFAGFSFLLCSHLAAQTALTNADILRLHLTKEVRKNGAVVVAKVEKKDILNAIRKDPTAFDMTLYGSVSLVALKNAGVHDDILLEMARVTLPRLPVDTVIRLKTTDINLGTLNQMHREAGTRYKGPPVKTEEIEINSSASQIPTNRPPMRR